MATLTAFKAKTRFGELLDRVARGDKIVISRHEKAVARLVPEGGANLEDTRQAVVELQAGRSSITKRRGSSLSPTEKSQTPSSKDIHRCLMPRIWNWRCDGSSRWHPEAEPSAKRHRAVASNSCCCRPGWMEPCRNRGAAHAWSVSQTSASGLSRSPGPK
jgi:prevent-host-death family protein